MKNGDLIFFATNTQISESYVIRALVAEFTGVEELYSSKYYSGVDSN